MNLTLPLNDQLHQWHFDFRICLATLFRLFPDQCWHLVPQEVRFRSHQAVFAHHLKLDCPLTFSLCHQNLKHLEPVHTHKLESNKCKEIYEKTINY